MTKIPIIEGMSTLNVLKDLELGILLKDKQPP